MKRIPKRYQVHLVILSMCVTGYFGRAIYFDKMTGQLNLILLVVSIVVGLGTWEFFRFINRILSKRYPIQEALIPRVIVQIGIGTLFVYILRGLGIYLVGDYFPLEFNWAFRAAIFVIDFFFSACLNAFFFIREYIGVWKQSIAKNQRLEKEKAQVQFDNLKNQLNPHFLFNALSSLDSLIKTDPELASRFLQNMSRVYRYVLKHKDKDLVSLNEELEFIREYLFLMETRFGEAFEFRCEVPEDKKEKGIVPVTLQILLENALKHNVINTQKPLKVCLRLEGDFLVMSNNLQKKRRVDGSNGLGLENLKKLYHYLVYKEVSWEEDEGEFRIRIPLID